MARVSRRDFLKSSGALVVPFALPGGGALAQPAADAKALPANAFLRIGSDGTCTVVVKHIELGQGSATALAMLVAEELECDWTKVRWEHAPPHPHYADTQWGVMITAGSHGVANSWEQLRTAGAQARAMLVRAAAEQWKAKASDVRADKGFVLGPGGRKLSYGQLAEAAGKLPVPEKVELKAAKDFRLIGKPVRRLDAADKVSGKAVFGSDVRRENLHVALVLRPPAFGAKLASFKADKAAGVPGLSHVVELANGVAVVGRNFWAAKQARDLLSAEWAYRKEPVASTDALLRSYREASATPGKVAVRPDDPDAFRSAARTVSATYELPFLAHAAMEPLNCTVDFRGESAEVWVGSQAPIADRDAAARVLGLKPEQVKLHVVLAGGGFGRRNDPGHEVVTEACEIARRVKVPVKLLWTREDDMRSGHYRPMFVHRVEAALDASGAIRAWKHVAVGSPIVAGAPPDEVARAPFDRSAIPGIRGPYELPNLDVTVHSADCGVPVLWWRSVSYSHTVFALESMIDEVAAAAGRDAVQVRRELLRNNARALRVLEQAAAKGGWGTPPPAGRGRGIALAQLRGSVCAQVAEVSLQGGAVKVHRVVTALDCGIAVNPLSVEAQVQGCVAYALSAALHGRITVKEGRVEQSNFHDYPLLRMDEMPRVETHLLPGGDRPGGVGEVGVPAVAPAVANALFALTGRRARALPLADTKWA